MTVSWTLTRERICDKALEKCQRLGVGRIVNGDDRALCLEALDSILKNLLWRGLSWPKTAADSTTLTLTAGLSSIALPSDFYTGARVNYVDASGNEVALPMPVTREEWASIPLKTTRASYPMLVYIDNFNVLHPYPLTNQTVILNLYYQRVMDDTSAQSSVALDSPWILGLVYGVAAEVGDEFGVKPDKLQRFEAKWERQLQIGIMNECPPGPDRIAVSD